MEDDLQTQIDDIMFNLDSALTNLREAKGSISERINQVEVLLAQLSRCISVQAKIATDISVSLVDGYNKLHNRLVILENKDRSNLFGFNTTH